MILCVFLTFSTVNATDLDDFGPNSLAIDSQSESSFANLNEDLSANIVKSDEDEDCVESVNELSNLDEDSNPSLSSINSDENSLKSAISPSGNTFSDIQSSIKSAKSGDVIELNGKTFTGNGSRIVIANKSITIRGGEGSTMATLDARNISAIFKISNSTINIFNCNLINSKGICVYILGGNGSIVNCNFRNNHANTLDAHLLVDENCTNFLVENSSFINGSSFEYSNVAVIARNSTVRNCTFINNVVENDYGVPVTGGGLQIGQYPDMINEGSVINCVFINNSAISNSGAHAGALCFRPGIKVFNSTFISNYCNNIGGATTLHADGEMFNCIFINNSAGVYGGAISTGLNENNISVNISSCIFEDNSAPMGGAIQVKGNNVKVVNSTFIGNNASDSDGGALFIMGNEAIIINSTFNENFAKCIGAGVLINGTDVTILNSSFDANVADYGGAIYVVGSNSNIFSSNFTNHKVINGSVFIKGPNTYVYDSNFKFNCGENGAAIYIKGSENNLIFNNFSFNNVTKRGGAIYIEGSNANILASDFLNNSAIPNKSDILSGLGGAIYIKGNDNTIDSSNLTFNRARNGSAIYTDGVNMVLSNVNFDKNQAWSYILDSTVYPLISYFNESDILINLTLIGGNNIANAIYNTASIDEIYFHNVSYISSKGPKVTGDDEIHPVDGAENSLNGSLLYQDDREDNQLVNVIIYREHSGNEPIRALDEDFLSHYEIILNETFTTGILGNISFNLSDYLGSPLKAGKYYLYAEHLEDDYYKEIDETNDFDIIPLVDVAIDIGSSRVNVDFNKTVKFTVKVRNNGPNDASEVNVNAIVPEGLVYLSSSPSAGAYDPESGIWHIGYLDVGENQTLTINVLTNRTGLIDYPVDVSSLEEDCNMTNNQDNKTIRVLMADLAITVNASEEIANFGGIVNWTISVVNNGPNNASKIVVILDYLDGELVYLDSSNDSFDPSNNRLEIPSLLVGDEISFDISTKLNVSNMTIKLNGTVSADTYDPIESNNFDSDSVNALPLCDLITKVSVSESPVNKDDVVDWVVVVSNDGPDGASDVVLSLSDLESLGLIVINSSDESFDDDEGIWTIGDLASGDELTLVITTQVDKSNGNITVVGEVETITKESDYENNVDNDSLAVNPLCDLIISIDVSNDTVNYGDIVDWIVVVSNDGPDGASDVVVSLSDFESLGLLVLNASDDSFDLEDYEWIIGDLDAGDSVSFNITVKANKSNDNITVNTDVETSTYEPNKENNHDNESLEILPICDIAVNIVPDNDTVHVDEIVNWVINVTNYGPDKADEVNVSNSFPENLEFIDFESNNGELEQITDEEGNVIDIIWKVGDLESNESAILVISTKALGEGTVLNNVSADSSTPDINESNNIDSASIDVIPADESSDENPDDGNESDNNPGNPENNSDESSDDYEDYDDDFSWLDYFLDNPNGNDAGNNDGDLGPKPKNPMKNPKKSIDLSKKKTANPFALAVLSLFALFALSYRKD